jgi:hypothetical protein
MSISGVMRAVSSCSSRVLGRCLFASVLGLATALSNAAPWADPAKTLRVAFEIDVTGFDPALARALLDRFSYRNRDGDGYREISASTRSSTRR